MQPGEKKKEEIINSFPWDAPLRTVFDSDKPFFFFFFNAYVTHDFCPFTQPGIEMYIITVTGTERGGALGGGGGGEIIFFPLLIVEIYTYDPRL